MARNGAETFGDFFQERVDDILAKVVSYTQVVSLISVDYFTTHTSFLQFFSFPHSTAILLEYWM